MKESSLGTTPATTVKVVGTAEAREHIEAFSFLIAQRAYEMFETEGRMPGHEFDQWFRAENELLHPMHIEIAESNDALLVSW